MNHKNRSKRNYFTEKNKKSKKSSKKDSDHDDYLRKGSEKQQSTKKSAESKVTAKNINDDNIEYYDYFYSSDYEIEYFYEYEYICSSGEISDNSDITSNTFTFTPVKVERTKSRVNQNEYCSVVEEIIGTFGGYHLPFDEKISYSGCYYVKFMDESYSSCQWLTKHQIEGVKGGIESLHRWNDASNNSLLFQSLSHPNLLVLAEDKLDSVWYIPERIINNTLDNPKEYLVKWKGLFYDLSSWETKDRLQNTESINRFLHKNINLLTIPTNFKRLKAKNFKEVTNNITSKSNDLLSKSQKKVLNWLFSQYCDNRNSIVSSDFGRESIVTMVASLNHISKQAKFRGPSLVIICCIDDLYIWKEYFDIWSNLDCMCFSGNEKSQYIIEANEFCPCNPNGRSFLNSVGFDVAIVSLDDYSRMQSMISSVEWRYVIIDDSDDSALSSSMEEHLKFLTFDTCTILCNFSVEANTHKHLFTLLYPKYNYQVLPEKKISKYLYVQNETDRRRNNICYISCPISHLHKNIVNGILSDLKKQMYSDGSLDYENPQNYIYLKNALLDLRRALVHPFLLPNIRKPNDSGSSIMNSSSKFTFCMKMANSLNEAMLFFSQLPGACELLSECFSRSNINHKVITCFTKSDEVNEILDQLSDGHIHIIIFSSKPGGLSITFSLFKYVVLIDYDDYYFDFFSAATELYALISCNTLEEYMKSTFNSFTFENSKKYYGRFSKLALGNSELELLIRSTGYMIQKLDEDDFLKYSQLSFEEMFTRNVEPDNIPDLPNVTTFWNTVKYLDIEYDRETEVLLSNSITHLIDFGFRMSDYIEVESFVLKTLVSIYGVHFNEAILKHVEQYAVTSTISKMLVENHIAEKVQEILLSINLFSKVVHILGDVDVSKSFLVTVSPFSNQYQTYRYVKELFLNGICKHLIIVRNLVHKIDEKMIPSPKTIVENILRSYPTTSTDFVIDYSPSVAIANINFGMPIPFEDLLEERTIFEDDSKDLDIFDENDSEFNMSDMEIYQTNSFTVPRKKKVISSEARISRNRNILKSITTLPTSDYEMNQKNLHICHSPPQNSSINITVKFDSSKTLSTKEIFDEKDLSAPDDTSVDNQSKILVSTNIKNDALENNKDELNRTHSLISINNHPFNTNTMVQPQTFSRPTGQLTNVYRQEAPVTFERFNEIILANQSIYISPDDFVTLPQQVQEFLRLNFNISGKKKRGPKPKLGKGMFKSKNAILLYNILIQHNINPAILLQLNNSNEIQGQDNSNQHLIHYNQNEMSRYNQNQSDNATHIAGISNCQQVPENVYDHIKEVTHNQAPERPFPRSTAQELQQICNQVHNRDHASQEYSNKIGGVLDNISEETRIGQFLQPDEHPHYSQHNEAVYHSPDIVTDREEYNNSFVSRIAFESDTEDDVPEPIVPENINESENVQMVYTDSDYEVLPSEVSCIIDAIKNHGFPTVSCQFDYDKIIYYSHCPSLNEERTHSLLNDLMNITFKSINSNNEMSYFLDDNNIIFLQRCLEVNCFVESFLMEPSLPENNIPCFVLPSWWTPQHSLDFVKGYNLYGPKCLFRILNSDLLEFKDRIPGSQKELFKNAAAFERMKIDFEMFDIGDFNFLSSIKNRINFAKNIALDSMPKYRINENLQVLSFGIPMYRDQYSPLPLGYISVRTFDGVPFICSIIGGGPEPIFCIENHTNNQVWFGMTPSEAWRGFAKSDNISGHWLFGLTVGEVFEEICRYTPGNYLHFPQKDPKSDIIDEIYCPIIDEV